MSPIPNFDEDTIESGDCNDSNITRDSAPATPDRRQRRDSNVVVGTDRVNENFCLNDNKTIETMEGKCMDDLTKLMRKNNNDEETVDRKVIVVETSEEGTANTLDHLDPARAKYSSDTSDNVHRVQSGNGINVGMGDVVVENVLPRDTSSDALSEARVTSNIMQIAHVDPEQCGLPLKLFTKVRNVLDYLTFEISN